MIALQYLLDRFAPMSGLHSLSIQITTPVTWLQAALEIISKEHSQLFQRAHAQNIYLHSLNIILWGFPLLQANSDFKEFFFLWSALLLNNSILLFMITFRKLNRKTFSLQILPFSI